MKEVVFRNGRRWVAARDVPDVTPVQMRLALHAAGELTTVNTIAATDEAAAIVWEYAVLIERKSPLIGRLKDNPIKSYTDAEIDAFFMAAANI